MFRRIQKIKGIGNFVDTSASQQQFEQLTFIYGENCYGKSTLCDIFASLSENNPEYIQSRKTIPEQNPSSQIVQFQIETNLSDKPPSVKYETDEWKQRLPTDQKLFVFDSNFIHRNVFTGATIERDNRENITSFILGEESVAVAENIAQLNKEKRDLNASVRRTESSTFKEVGDIDKFVGLEIKDTKKEVEEKLADLAAKGKETQATIDAIDSIKKRDALVQIKIKIITKIDADTANNTFESNLTNVHEEAQKIVEKHINQHIKPSQGDKTWLQQGLNYRKDDNCPYCGQLLGDFAKSLLNAYQSCFDKTFEEFASRIKRELRQNHQLINGLVIEDTKAHIDNNNLRAKQYKELEKDDAFLAKINALNALETDIIKFVKEFNEELRELLKNYEKSAESKEKAPYEAAAALDFTNLLESQDKLQKILDDYNRIVGEENKLVQTFKSNLTQEKLEKELQQLRGQYSAVKLEEKRADLNEQCEQYKREKDRITEIDKELSVKTIELENIQTTYLSNYFEEINRCFKKYGSSDFVIEKHMEKRGILPVVSLKIKFKEKEIPAGQLKSVFSESDKRALAFSIFWAKVSLQSDDDKSRSIIVLDDPVTSFDENRITKTLMEIKLAIQCFRQLIVLSHYKTFLRRFYKQYAYDNSFKTKLVKIEKQSDGSHIVGAVYQDYIEGEQERAYRRISEFIERVHHEDVCKDLRIYLETEIENRFRHQIRKKNIVARNLSELIEALHMSGLIEDSVKMDLEVYRVTLNPEHHAWTDMSHEEKVSLATDLLNFIYTSIVPRQIQ